MAKLTQTMTGDFDEILSRIVNGILNSSISATLEETSDFITPTARCSVRVFERYSYLGSNRVSLNVTLFQSEGTIHLCAVTSGGSQAVFFKINTFGEQNFLEKLKEIL